MKWNRGWIAALISSSVFFSAYTQMKWFMPSSVKMRWKESSFNSLPPPSSFPLYILFSLAIEFDVMSEYNIDNNNDDGWVQSSLCVVYIVERASIGNSPATWEMGMPHERQPKWKYKHEVKLNKKRRSDEKKKSRNHLVFCQESTGCWVEFSYSENCFFSLASFSTVLFIYNN